MELEKTIQGNSSVITQLNSEIEGKNHEIDMLQSQISSLEMQGERKDKTITTNSQTIKTLQEDNKNLKSYMEEYEETNNSLSDALTSCKVENGELNYKIKNFEEQVENLEQQISSLEEQNSNLQQQQTSISNNSATSSQVSLTSYVSKYANLCEIIEDKRAFKRESIPMKHYKQPQRV